MSCKVLNCFTFFHRPSCLSWYTEPHKSRRRCDNLHKICTKTHWTREFWPYRILRSADQQPLELCRIRVSIGILNGALTIKFSAAAGRAHPKLLFHFIDNLRRQFPLPHLHFYLLFRFVTPLCGLKLGTVPFGQWQRSGVGQQVETITWLRFEDLRLQVLKVPKWLCVRNSHMWL